MLSVIKKKAFAKINLSLLLTGVLPNGYHTICSLIHKISLHDQISLSLNNEKRISVICNKPVCDEKDNLAYRSAKIILDKFNIENNTNYGADIEIVKNIPFGAGLGGGSSDCACVLDILNEELCGFSQQYLHDTAEKLGADVPFCLNRHKFCLASGTGTTLIDIKSETPSYKVLIIKPDIFCGTADMYKFFDNNFSFNKENITEQTIKEQTFFPQIFNFCCNDFEKAARVLYPDIQNIINSLKKLSPLYAGMSGSGSSIFAVFENSVDVNLCLQSISKEFNHVIESAFIESFV